MSGPVASGSERSGRRDSQVSSSSASPPQSADVERRKVEALAIRFLEPARHNPHQLPQDLRVGISAFNDSSDEELCYKETNSTKRLPYANQPLDGHNEYYDENTSHDTSGALPPGLVSTAFPFGDHHTPGGHPNRHWVSDSCTSKANRVGGGGHPKGSTPSFPLNDSRPSPNASSSSTHTTAPLKQSTSIDQKLTMVLSLPGPADNVIPLGQYDSCHPNRNTHSGPESRYTSTTTRCGNNPSDFLFCCDENNTENTAAAFTHHATSQRQRLSGDHTRPKSTRTTTTHQNIKPATLSLVANHTHLKVFHLMMRIAACLDAWHEALATAGGPSRPAASLARKWLHRCINEVDQLKKDISESYCQAVLEARLDLVSALRDLNSVEAIIATVVIYQKQLEREVERNDILSTCEMHGLDWITAAATHPREPESAAGWHSYFDCLFHDDTADLTDDGRHDSGEPQVQKSGECVGGVSPCSLDKGKNTEYDGKSTSLVSAVSSKHRENKYLTATPPPSSGGLACESSEVSTDSVIDRQSAAPRPLSVDSSIVTSVSKYTHIAAEVASGPTRATADGPRGADYERRQQSSGAANRWAKAKGVKAIGDPCSDDDDGRWKGEEEIVIKILPPLQADISRYWRSHDVRHITRVPLSRAFVTLGVHGLPHA